MRISQRFLARGVRAGLRRAGLFFADDLPVPLVALYGAIEK